MILADTSIWIDHLRVGRGDLAHLLERSAILGHPWVTGEVALGHLRDRAGVVGLLQALPQAVTAADDEVLDLISRQPLHGLGVGWVDAQLLASTRLTPDALLWTSDRRLADAAAGMAVVYRPS